MAWTTPYTFIALQALTAAQLNAMQANITTLFPYTSAGDLAYASSSTVLSRLAKGTAGQFLKMNSGATAPEWGSGCGLALIESQTLTDAVSSVTFSSIPSTYKHLKIMCQGVSSTPASLQTTFNEDGGNNYSWSYILGTNNNLVQSALLSSRTSLAIGQFSSDIGGIVADILNYSGAIFGKNVISNSNIGNKVYNIQGSWSGTDAINRIDISVSGSLSAGCIFSLYGMM